MTDFNNIDLGNKSYHFIRTETRFFNISGCSVLTDGVIADRDGLIPNAIWVSDDEVADYVGAVEARNQQLQRVETLLRDWTEVRRAQSRKAKTAKVSLRKEVAK